MELFNQERYPEAERLYRNALEMGRRLYPNQDHPDLALTLNNLAFVLKARGEYAQAEADRDATREIKRRLAGSSLLRQELS